MLVLEPVSKYKKQAKTIIKKAKTKTYYSSAPPLHDSMSPSQIISQNYDSSEIMSYQKRQFEDSQLTKFLQEQITVCKYTMSLLAMGSLLLSIEMGKERLHNMANLIVQSLITASLLISVVLKYILTIDLSQKQLKRMVKENAVYKFMKNNGLEVLIVLCHPNLMTKGVSLAVEDPIFNGASQLPVNTILQILMMMRIYLLYQSILESSIFFTSRSARICRMYNSKNQQLFSFKSYFNSNPLTSLLILYLTLVIVYGQMLRLSEEVSSSSNGLEHLQNSTWNVIITMSTVGYGDYYPTTSLGRMVSFLAAISGIIMASLLILTLSKYLTMSSGQSKSHVTLKRLQIRALLQKYCSETFVQATLPVLSNHSPSSQSVSNLKKKTQKVKMTIRRLKNLVDSQNINEEVNHLFESLGQNLAEIYCNQNRTAEQLTELYIKDRQLIKDQKFTFANEIQQIIREQ